MSTSALGRFCLSQPWPSLLQTVATPLRVWALSRGDDDACRFTSFWDVESDHDDTDDDTTTCTWPAATGRPPYWMDNGIGRFCEVEYTHSKERFIQHEI